MGMALINDDLTGSVLMFGSLISAVATAAIGYGIGAAFYGDYPDKDIRVTILSTLTVYGALAGLILCLCTLRVVESAIVSIFVCFAEAPAALHRNHIEEYETLVEAHSKFKTISEEVSEYSDGGGNASA